LKLMKWVKSDEKLQWSDDEDDGALEQALGAAAEHGAPGEGGEEGEANSDEEDEDSREAGDVTPVDGGSFPASGVQTPKEVEVRPHPLRKEVKLVEDGEDEEGEEGEEGDDEGDGEKGPDKDGAEDGAEGEGEEEDADLNVPPPNPEGDFPVDVDDSAPGPSFPGHEEGGEELMDVGEGFDEAGFEHMSLDQIAHKELVEGEDVFDHEGGIEEALGQEPLGLVNADNPQEHFS